MANNITKLVVDGKTYELGFTTEKQTEFNEIIQSESSRVSAEKTRVAQETDRKNAEAARVTAENSRVSAETARVTAENTRETDENARKTAEKARAAQDVKRDGAFNLFNTNSKTTYNSKTDMLDIKINIPKYNSSSKEFTAEEKTICSVEIPTAKTYSLYNKNYIDSSLVEASKINSNGDYKVGEIIDEYGRQQNVYCHYFSPDIPNWLGSSSDPKALFPYANGGSTEGKCVYPRQSSLVSGNTTLVTVEESAGQKPLFAAQKRRVNFLYSFKLPSSCYILDYKVYSYNYHLDEINKKVYTEKGELVSGASTYLSDLKNPNKYYKIPIEYLFKYDIYYGLNDYFPITNFNSVLMYQHGSNSTDKLKAVITISPADHQLKICGLEGFIYYFIPQSAPKT